MDLLNLLDLLVDLVEIVIDGGKYYSKEYGLFLKDYESQEELSPQELKVLRFVADGLTSQQIAGNMFVSVNTVEFHRRRIMRKLGVANMAELIKKAIEKYVKTFQDVAYNYTDLDYPYIEIDLTEPRRQTGKGYISVYADRTLVEGKDDYVYECSYEIKINTALKRMIK